MIGPRSSAAGLEDELAAYRPHDAREAQMAAALLAFVRSNSDAADRRLLAGHLTGSAWIVDCSGSAAILGHHRKLGKWLQLGGHADGERDLRLVALREAREESGLISLAPASSAIYDLDVHPIPARGGEPAHLHYDVRFAFFADRAEEPRVSDESFAVAWVPLAELERYSVDDSVRRLAAKTPLLRSGMRRRCNGDGVAKRID